MKILNIEDDAIKHTDICKVLGSCGCTDVEWAKNLEDALEMAKGGDFALYITDMWFPKTKGGVEEESGESFIRQIEKSGDATPVIMCSSVNYRIPNILGTVHYSDKSDWETELQKLLKEVIVV